MSVTALVREPSPRLADDAELTFLPRRPVDLALARAQHAAYIEVLTRLGAEVVWLPPLPACPDGVFVEDTVVIVDRLAVLTHPGAPSRRAEVDSLRPTLDRRGWATASIVAPATLDGGDVLQIGRTVYVGLSTRSDRRAVEQLAALLDPLGRSVIGVPIDGALHLKTAATALPDGTILAIGEALDVGAFHAHEVVEPPETAGANVLLVGPTVVVPTSAPMTAELIAGRGFDVVSVDLSELEKVEAGPTCLSVLLPLPGRDRPPAATRPSPPGAKRSGHAGTPPGRQPPAGAPR